MYSYVYTYIYTYIYIYIYVSRELQKCDTGVCEQKLPSGEEDPLEDEVAEHQIRWWRACLHGSPEVSSSWRMFGVLVTPGK